MSALYDNTERLARALPLKEKADLASLFIKGLDQMVDADVEQMWVDERRRHDGHGNRFTGETEI